VAGLIGMVSLGFTLETRKCYTNDKAVSRWYSELWGVP